MLQEVGRKLLRTKKLNKSYVYIYFYKIFVCTLLYELFSKLVHLIKCGRPPLKKSYAWLHACIYYICVHTYNNVQSTYIFIKAIK